MPSTTDTTRRPASSPYFKLSTGSEKQANSRRAQADLRRGIALYQAVVQYAPSNWNAFWLMGKTYQALNDHSSACDAFGKAFAIQKKNPDVAREYMLECLDLGRTNEAIFAAEHALSLEPRNSGLMANLALAYVMAGRNSEAMGKIEEAVRTDPTDKISITLRRVIREVRDGKRPQPRTVEDLEKP